MSEQKDDQLSKQVLMFRGWTNEEISLVRKGLLNLGGADTSLFNREEQKLLQKLLERLEIVFVAGHDADSLDAVKSEYEKFAPGHGPNK